MHRPPASVPALCSRALQRIVLHLAPPPNHAIRHAGGQPDQTLLPRAIVPTRSATGKSTAAASSSLTAFGHRTVSSRSSVPEDSPPGPSSLGPSRERLHRRLARAASATSRTRSRSGANDKQGAVDGEPRPQE